MNIFPEEILFEISLRLPFKDLFSYFLTCKKTNGLLKNKKFKEDIIRKHLVFVIEQYHYLDTRTYNKLPNGVIHGFKNTWGAYTKKLLLTIEYDLGVEKSKTIAYDPMIQKSKHKQINNVHFTKWVSFFTNGTYHEIHIERNPHSVKLSPNHTEPSVALFYDSDNFTHPEEFRYTCKYITHEGIEFIKENLSYENAKIVFDGYCKEYFRDFGAYLREYSS